ncbi:zinc-binding dehydrogenase [Caulobacter sp. S45]|uniref:zinc-binding dehydrogenase n=1 Tax=Caulobacter sp. S45 TaxID=1641861 RepID=UPI00157762C8|nr:zinc-binding dehydrogenase [Caulobacter sp. S45]
MNDDQSRLELRSLIKSDGELELSFARVARPEPGPSEVLVQMQAAPINPSDLGLLVGAADLGSATTRGEGAEAVVTAAVPAPLMRSMAGRLDQSMPVGNEGAGRVVAAGSSPEAQALLGRTVAIAGGSTYAQYRKLRAADCLPLPEGASAQDGASSFVNPLTALGMVETMRAEGHSALVHTAAASNLGQMLNRICLADGVTLVNIVRSGEQAVLLREAGAVHVCDTSSADFMSGLVEALKATGATLAFDAIGGGRLAGQILSGMEQAAASTGPYSRYGSTVHKQVYIYGALDTRPTELVRSFGFAWSVGGWLLTPFLQKAGAAKVAELRGRVATELKTTFASRYSKVISLTDMLKLDNLHAYNRRATGEKYLVDPSLG